jgi:demethylmenaquinone methyltransferase/2-methoxy-6-polyprenyl-1,4-benzoquinol methylase
MAAAGSEPAATTRALDEQRRFYDLRAPDYLTDAPTDRVQADTVDPRFYGVLVDELAPAGDVLELACGPGGFTRELARHARSVTAVDASPRMLARNEREVASPNVRYVAADLFAWTPETTYDVVFFGFFLSHVPPGAFATFWDLVRACLCPGGRVAFVDEDDRNAHYDDVRIVDGVPLARRTLVDGRSFDVVKVFWDPDALATRLRELDWAVDVRRFQPGILRGTGVDARD